MPRQKRHKTNYPGVYYIQGTHPATGKPERIFYITYRIGRKRYEEKAGRQQQDDMTAARASLIRAKKINSEIPPNAVRRIEEVERQSLVFNDLFDQFMRSKTNLKRPKEYEYLYKNWLKRVIGSITPDTLYYTHIADIEKKMVGKKPQTIKHVLALIVRIVNFGIERNLCDPIRIKIKMPRFDNTRTEILSPLQIEKLQKVLDKEPNPQVRGIMRLALYTGMRKSEILRLRWKEVNFEHSFITILNPKGVVTENIPMNENAKKTLEELKGYYGDQEYVLPSSTTGKNRNRNAFKNQVRDICDKAGLPSDFRPLHGARHAYASFLAANGVDLYTIQKLLGHKSSRMTQRYAHLQDETLRRATNIMDQVVDTKRERPS